MDLHKDFFRLMGKAFIEGALVVIEPPESNLCPVVKKNGKVCGIKRRPEAGVPDPDEKKPVAEPAPAPVIPRAPPGIQAALAF